MNNTERKYPFFVEEKPFIFTMKGYALFRNPHFIAMKLNGEDTAECEEYKVLNLNNIDINNIDENIKLTEYNIECLPYFAAKVYVPRLLNCYDHIENSPRIIYKDGNEEILEFLSTDFEAALHLALVKYYGLEKWIYRVSINQTYDPFKNNENIIKYCAYGYGFNNEIRVNFDKNDFTSKLNNFTKAQIGNLIDCLTFKGDTTFLFELIKNVGYENVEQRFKDKIKNLILERINNIIQYRSHKYTQTIINKLKSLGKKIDKLDISNNGRESEINFIHILTMILGLPTRSFGRYDNSEIIKYILYGK